MGFFDGIIYNLKSLRWALRSRKLLLLGMTRFFAMLILTLFCGSLVLVYHQEIMSSIWNKPQGGMLTALWYLLSWAVSLLLSGLSAILSYLLAQILFSAVIMDIMSQVTEKLVTGRLVNTYEGGKYKAYIYLITQEAPRSVFPILLTSLLVVLGWLTPLGPVLTVLSPFVVVIFLAWDNTDLIPARQMIPFRDRVRFLTKTLPFHLGFGLLFLIPMLNILLLSFAPIGGTLYHLDRLKKKAFGAEPQP
ncbi:MAG: EI24 domain-containing protein [Syntrophobacteraceae bacterium]